MTGRGHSAAISAANLPFVGSGAMPAGSRRYKSCEADGEQVAKHVHRRSGATPLRIGKLERRFSGRDYCFGTGDCDCAGAGDGAGCGFSSGGGARVNLPSTMGLRSSPSQSS